LLKNFRKGKWIITPLEKSLREAPRSSRPSRSTTRFRTSYNEDLMSPNIGDEGDDGDAHPSIFPYTNFLSDVGILDDFLLLVDRVGLTTYMLDESDQYAMLRKIFVESFKFSNSAFKPSIAFKIYDKSITMLLERFCSTLGIPMFGMAKRNQNRPADLLELYRGVTNDDDHIAQRAKIRNINSQLLDTLLTTLPPVFLVGRILVIFLIII
jgi:hypothetical protein